jgi:pimeloyl-ACP methyl ester carboxylesterase
MVDVRGERLHVLRGGEGPPILFLHGTGGGGLWLPFHERLAASHEVIATTHPGYGESPDLEWLDDMDDLVHFYLDFLDSQDLHDVAIVGASLGGWLAAELAVHHSEWINHLVLLAAVGLELPEHPYVDMFGLNPAQTVDAVFFDPATAASMFPAEPDVDFILAMYREAGTSSRLAWNPLFANPRLERRLHRVSSPTLVISAAQDRIVSTAHGERYAERIPNARHVVLDDAAHAAYIESPERVATLILDFLREA